MMNHIMQFGNDSECLAKVSVNNTGGEELLFQSEKHYEDSYSRFNYYRKEKIFCDVILKIDNEAFDAHKLVLSSVSPFFDAMFTTQGMVEKDANIVELHNVDRESFSSLLDFIYTSKLVINDENVQQLLPASDILRLTNVRDACCQYLQNQLDPSNALGILLFGDTHSCHDLVKNTEEYVLENFISISGKEEFLSLSYDRVKFFIGSGDLKIDDESNVYNALMSWIKHDVIRRKQYLFELLSLVRLPLLPTYFLISTVEPNELIKDDASCKDLIIEAMKYQLMPEMRPKLQGKRTKPRGGLKRIGTLFALGGQSLFAIHSECEYFDSVNNTWNSMTPMLGRRARLGIGIINDKLYSVGGYDGSNDLAIVEIYNIKTKQWSEGNSMGTSRSCLGVAVLHDLLYCIGGYDGNSCLNSVERYDPLSKQWVAVSMMNSRRRYVSVGVIGGYIIAAGGYDGNQHLDSCEVFDPNTNIWTKKSPMKTQRSSAGGCVLNELFYISGGTDGTVIVTSVERYDFQVDEWCSIKTMSNVRMTHALVPSQGKLLAIGGNDGTTSLNSVEEYDVEKDEWIFKPSMTIRRSHIAAAIGFLE